MQKINEICEHIARHKIFHSSWTYIGVGIGWALLAFWAGMAHEPWADEAQSWLIARDCSFKELFVSISHYEGTPALFYLILKLLQGIGLPYKLLFLVPFTCTAIGVYLFLFRSKLPALIKILFPFTFFIAYQYAVLARNYVLIWPLLGLLAVFHRRRFERPFGYGFLLLLLASVSAYGMVLAGVLLGYYLYGLLQTKNKKVHTWLSGAIVIAGMLLTVIYTSKAADCTFPAYLKFPHLLDLIRAWVSGFAAQTSGIGFWVIFGIVVGFYASALWLFCKNWTQRIFFVGLNGMLVVCMASLYYALWHSGYLMMTVIFTLWVLLEENKTCMDRKFWIKWVFYGCWLILAFIQISWTTSSLSHEVLFPFSGSKAAAHFIQEHKLTDYSINGLGFKAMALQPYFKHNVYGNFSKAYFVWKKSERRFQQGNALQADVLVWSGEALLQVSYVLEELNKNYDGYEFKGSMPLPGNNRDHDTIIVMVRKGIL